MNISCRSSQQGLRVSLVSSAKNEKTITTIIIPEIDRNVAIRLFTPDDILNRLSFIWTDNILVASVHPGCQSVRGDLVVSGVS